MTARTMLGLGPLVATVSLNSPAFAADDPDPNAIARLVETVKSPGPGNTAASLRDQAALELVNRDTPESRAAVLAALRDTRNPDAQAAIAKAVAQTSDLDPQLIPVLGGLLGPNSELDRAAAAALANYSQTGQVFEQLKRFIDIQNNSNPGRQIAIRAIGALVAPEPAEAGYLIELLNRPNENQAIKEAATEALSDMTGLTSYGKDVGKWQQWWNGVHNDTVDQFKAMILPNRSLQLNQLRPRNAQLVDVAGSLLNKPYYDAPPSAKDGIVLNYLNSPSPDIRFIGVELVHYDFGRPLGAAVTHRLIAMIGDGDDKVRESVGGYMRDLNDKDSLHPLLAQLAIEKNSKIKSLIAEALGRLQDPAAVPQLQAMLQDNQNDDVTAAARAFASLGENLRKVDPNKAYEVSAQIRQILSAQKNQRGTDDLCAACLDALAALRDPKSFDTFMDWLKQGTSFEEIRAALVGLGNLGDKNADQTVANRLEDRDPKIRLEAARALRTVGTTGFEETIFQHMINDSDPGVREALWVALQSIFDAETPAQLKSWENRFDKDPDKKLIVLEKLGEAEKRAKDLQSYVYTEQDIAKAMMDVKPQQLSNALPRLQDALNYWRNGAGKNVGESGDKLYELIGQILDDQLLAGQWTQACDFAQQQISISKEYGGVVGQKITSKIDELINKDNKPDDAKKLIDAALGMKPPLDEKYIKLINQSQAQLQQAPGQ